MCAENVFKVVDQPHPIVGNQKSHPRLALAYSSRPSLFPSVPALCHVCPSPVQTVQTIVKNCQVANVHGALVDLRALWRAGYAALDIVGTLFRVTRNSDLPDRTKLAFIREISFSHMKIADGVNSLLQLTGLIGRLCQVAIDEEKNKLGSH